MTAPEPTPVATGGFVTEDGIEWYRIDGYDRLDPFLVNMVFPTDQWMWASTSGALTAGRRDAHGALFPYETDDRLHRSGRRTGPVTMVRVGDVLWEPFLPEAADLGVRRSVAKTAVGDRLRFEEHHAQLGLTFRYTWSASDRFGFVRTCELTSETGKPPRDVVVLDGLVDVLPAGVDLAAQQTSSTLVDAYRRSELDHASGVAVYTLEALVSDRPEPAESLRATLVWSTGLDDATVTLSDRHLRTFRSGAALTAEHLVTGRKGAYLLTAPLRLTPGSTVRWSIVADVERDHIDFADLRAELVSTRALQPSLDEAAAAGHRTLVGVVAGADALQETGDRAASVHHFANVLFNVMRGGVFLDEHRVRVARVAAFVSGRNAAAAPRFATAVAGLGDVVEIAELRTAVRGDADLERLVDEYLPLSFSRRHGDPSRPWNTFRISVRSDSGSLSTGYEGNWRDIFQNWDALLHSYPEFFESVIAKFLNASTVDGFNPYRITDAGIDWEMPEHGHWANLGYWGDHQIVYLHRLLDAERRFHPGVLESRLDRVCFSYADIPYRIRPYDQIAANPKDTIVFDDDRQAQIDRRVEHLGGDGRLVPSADGDGIHHASLAEKLLVPALAKLSNFVAGGGIWMNTQRPEWNDANNALVGNGVSMVTLVYLEQYLALLDEILADPVPTEVPMSGHVTGWMRGLATAFRRHQGLLDEVTATGRRSLLDAVGAAYSDYREVAYHDGPGPLGMVPMTEVREFVALVHPFLRRTREDAWRSDGHAESYVLLRLEPGVAHIEPLYEMLEGQVAVLSDPRLDPEAAVRVIDTLLTGDLYREDQRSFLLYPDRELPPFWEKNVVPPEALGRAATAVLDGESRILRRDAEGVVRFSAMCRSAREVAAALERHVPELDPAGRAEILELYERVFRHAAFTGRSGTMYKYEGLGSVYWHMVSKLLFALGEHVARAAHRGDPASVVDALAERYRRVRSGLGFMKTVTEQGTFPTDPHSHTPGGSGAQQPGMTGQVKEGVLLRWSELGVAVADGRLWFRPLLLSPAEFLDEPRPWEPLDGGALEPGSLGFTYCGIPVVYHLVDDHQPWCRVTWSDGREVGGDARLDVDTSRAVFARRGEITRIDVGIPGESLLGAPAGR